MYGMRLSMARVDRGPRRGSTLGAVRARFRSAWLGWTDPESGERLAVRLSGSSELMPELFAQGFELLPESRGGEPLSRVDRYAEARIEPAQHLHDLARVGDQETNNTDKPHRWRSLAFVRECPADPGSRIPGGTL